MDIKIITKDKENKQGISLIVLVITIIVIVIIAVAVILTLAKNNPIENAKKAVFQNDLKTIQEEVSMYDSNEYLEALLAGNTYTKVTTSGEEMVSLFPNTKNYKNKIKVVRGEIKLIENATEQEKLWASEIGIESQITDVWDGSTDTAWYDNNKDATSYDISTAEELAGLAKVVNDGIDTFEGKTINLMNSLDLNNIKWTPIGYQHEGYIFCGKFEGNNCVVSNMKITETRGDYFYSGLFENVIQLANYNGEVYVKNLILRDSYISGDRAGSIIGYLASNNHSNAQCSIQNCASINNYIDGNESAGGVVNNLFDSVVRSCYNTSIVVCTYYSANPIMDLPNGIGVAGGITAGCIDESSIINCYNTGDITASGCYAGGIVGGCSAYHITNCYNVGLINGKENYIGEIAGHAEF